MEELIGFIGLIVTIRLFAQLVLLHPNYAFTRGKASRGEVEYYGCEDFENCSEQLPAGNYQPAEFNPRKCHDHGKPINVLIKRPAT